MGNNASRQGEKDRDRDRDVVPTPTSPLAQQTTPTFVNARKDARSGSVRRSHRDDTSASSSIRSHSISQSASTNTAASQNPQPAKDEKMGAEHSKHRHEDKVKPKVAPVKVPRGSDPHRQRGPDSQFEPFGGPPPDPNYVPHSNLNFPPRLPLPIEKEVHSPGSPIIPAQGDDASALDQADVEGQLPRQTSNISSTTADDDELGNEFLQGQVEPAHGYVPTQISWRQGGDRVYVTGTFAQWGTKIRMQRDSKTGNFSTVLQLRPGTHHVKFIVDGEMQLSDELPTAVDYSNILVNYIEVSADDMPKDRPTTKPSESEAAVPEGVYPPQVLPTGTDVKDYATDSVGKAQPTDPQPKAEPVYWGKEVPAYLLDVDQPEQSNRYQRAAKVISDFPAPPGLPLFLGKSILNGATPMKDDASVLNMPNHTVLNHLATSSIKNGVLATSITTRYIRKYVTTIVYKPTEDNE